MDIFLYWLRIQTKGLTEASLTFFFLNADCFMGWVVYKGRVKETNSEGQLLKPCKDCSCRGHPLRMWSELRHTATFATCLVDSTPGK